MSVDLSLTSILDPYWSLVILIPGIYATLFQIFGARRKPLIYVWATCVIGFVLGQALAGRFFAPAGIRLGGVQIVESSLAAWVLMFVANRVRLW